MAQRKVKKAKLSKIKASKKSKSKAASKKSKAPAKKVRAASKKSKSVESPLVSLTIVHEPSFKPAKSAITAWINRIAFELQMRSSVDERLMNREWSGAELTIAFLNADHARELNLKYREKDYATDVLSFGDTTPGVLGELAICPEVVLRNANEHGLSFEDELGYMILHGVLHLLGFDHEASKEEENVMFELQDSVFDALRSARG